MSKYGKLTDDGHLILEENPLLTEHEIIFNPTDEEYQKAGWLPIEYTQKLPAKDGYIVVDSYTEVEEKTEGSKAIPRHIEQVWNYKEISTEEPSITAQEYAAVVALAKLEVKTLELTDEQAQEVSALFDEWNGAGIAYKKGEFLRYKELLYKVAQDHTSQSDWTPDTAHSLFTPVGKPDEGTQENPIVWVDGMASEEGKYYTDESVLYLSIESSGIGLYGKPKDLPRYFKAV